MLHGFLVISFKLVSFLDYYLILMVIRSVLNHFKPQPAAEPSLGASGGIITGAGVIWLGLPFWKPWGR